MCLDDGRNLAVTSGVGDAESLGLALRRLAAAAEIRGSAMTLSGTALAVTLKAGSGGLPVLLFPFGPECEAWSETLVAVCRLAQVWMRTCRCLHVGASRGVHEEESRRAGRGLGLGLEAGARFVSVAPRLRGSNRWPVLDLRRRRTVAP
ncbi:hypothetical protein SKAU_G00316930 [Synaphobranchus kaupii]|uniref:Uncharacterized protein n=1 Tax=Synaphobranchus kaupii TaxID=118154 RepID=A0A9Q1IJP8_SYNKA|nr:hypothetical protein SKAU_G00316930 [Synaphobranchus kaupii]